MSVTLKASFCFADKDRVLRGTSFELHLTEKVVIGRWKGARVAVKVLQHGGADEKGNAVVAREAVIGAALSHPDVVRLS